MKKNCVFLFFLLGHGTLVSQNLVPNHSFEDLSDCPNRFDQISYAHHWGPGTESGMSSSDVYYDCVPENIGEQMGVPINIQGTQNARHGKGYAGIFMFFNNTDNNRTYREYLQVPLTEKMVAGKKYGVSFYVSFAEHSLGLTAIRDVGAYFSAEPPYQERYPEESPPSQEMNKWSNIRETPQIKNESDEFLSDTRNWMKIEGQFIARGDEKFLTIGNFKNNRDTQYSASTNVRVFTSYYYVDLVTVFECDRLVTLPGDTVICAGNPLSVDIFLDGSSYEWQDGSTTSSYIINFAGTYWVDVYNNGCHSRDSIVVSTRDPGTFSFDTDKVFCEGDSVKIEAPLVCEPPFLWSNNSVENFIYVSESGDYWLKADFAGCERMAHVEVDQEYLVGAMLSDTTLCNGQILNITLDISDRGTLWSTGSREASIDIDTSGFYQVNISGEVCRESVEFTAAFYDCPDVIPNIITPNNDDHNDYFVVEQIENDRWLLEIYDRYGKRIYFNPQYDNSWQAREKPSGVYYYYLLNQNSGKSFKGYIHVIRSN